jgi:hypothetical protein
MFERIIKIILMVLTAFCVFAPTMVGGLFMVIAVVFCDVGPLSRCEHMGWQILSQCCGFAVIPIPALITLISGTTWLKWYLWPFPFAAAGMACFVQLQKIPFSLFVSSIYGALAFLGFLYLSVSRKRVMREQRTHKTA